MSLSHRFVVGFFKNLTGLMCRIDDQELKHIQAEGPLIIYTNHVNVLEIPIIYCYLQPRKVHGMLLASRWKIPVLNWCLDVTETIPLQRGEADVDAVRLGLQALERDEMLIIAPEGTRSHTGVLQAGHPGVVLLALHSGAPLLPVAYYGGENYANNLRHLKRTDFHLRVGQPFHINARGKKVNREVREQMVQEMMAQLARVLPPAYRGDYGSLPELPAQYLEFG